MAARLERKTAVPAAAHWPLDIRDVHAYGFDTRVAFSHSFLKHMKHSPAHTHTHTHTHTHSHTHRTNAHEHWIGRMSEMPHRNLGVIQRGRGRKMQPSGGEALGRDLKRDGRDAKGKAEQGCHRTAQGVTGHPDVGIGIGGRELNEDFLGW
ncbi:hypothetical protein BC937DRAFT_89938 [Endogone sp. FLAS-F59071]|nr:hypothetical protein BC937DRAFT_89938 [Endogone sp. FLAS-F59071]|eukprot:RUS17470.1 hypothetical protein BC937DRAFT_89938 [Endogone sp. FLAS-F59071]